MKISISGIMRQRDLLFTIKLAVSVMLAFIDNEHVPVPAQPPPDQPVKVEPAEGTAVSVTTEPGL